MSDLFKGQPITAADCDVGWIAERREVVRRDGRALAAGADHTIVIKSITPVDQLAAWDPLRLNAWVPMMLPNDAHRFATAADRDAVLAELQKGTP